ncbi:histone-lysine N-methyltransferase SUVR5 [Cynara cardunculus var. scolymus]|uniref:histone-lysine N-methyltransferase SUVR5 n=1 Tax=Cynara cardunculus var. scolymus TaxID=59895 RepID=UPI000D62C1FE|nr:histone-lysine N-methyltransferase SUVR5 [Cynara cardunculus var. scolymus]
MQVLPCTDVHYAGESNSPNQGSEKAFMYDGGANKHELIQEGNTKVDNHVLNMEASDDEQFGDGDWKLDESSPTIEGDPKREPFHELEVDDQKLSSNSRDSGVDSLDADTVGRELPSGNQECESSRSEPKWLEQDQPMAVWVKWRGKWQAGIRCARSDWPLSTVRAKPTHDRKQYLVIFFPRKRNYSWADVLLLRPINEFPEPIAYRSHNVGVKVLKDLTVARRFIMQKIAVSMINTIEQLNNEALTETARSMVVWKDFALEASRCKDYSDLGNMLLKLEKMILARFINSYWLEHSLETWMQQCRNANSAESIEMLKEELGEAINWNEVHMLSNATVQAEVGSEWKTLKPEVMKWFSMSNPSFNTGDTEQQSNDGFSNTGLQVSRKRPKLEIRRAEMQTPQMETEGSNQSLPIEIDSRFFNGQMVNSPIGLSRAEVSLLGTTETIDYPSSSTTDRWGEIVVEAGNMQETRLKNLEVNPVNKNKQCTAFIEAKGRRCVRWANDGDVYCCVHLASRFSANLAKPEVSTPPVDAQMCEGTTVLGTKCKHRSLPGSSFCKKHRSNKDTVVILPSPPENKLKRKIEDRFRDLPEANSCKEIVISGHFGTPPPVDTSNGLFQTEQLGKEYNGTETIYCIGDGVSCRETPKRHTLYCEKHLPNWLKRARNGKSRIISKEVFIDLLKSCQSHEQKLHLHQACELFYKFFKSVLSLRSPVPKEIQLQWVMSEASKDVKTRHFLTKLVCSEKERLIRLWGFNSDNIAQNSSATEEPVKFLMADDNKNNVEGIVKCNICSEKLLDDQMLAKHWIDNHKEEARLLFKRYVCAICLDSFTENNLLEAHVQERHHVQFVEQCMLYQCIPCSSRFGNPDQLWSHVLSHHPANFNLPHVVQLGEDSLETRDYTQVQNVNSDNQDGLQKYICRFCGLKFDLLPDLGRHHQAAHMGSIPTGSRVSKRGVPFYANKLKSGRLSRPRFKKGLGAAQFKIRNRGAGSIKKHIQAPFREVVEGEFQSTESVSLGRLAEFQCSDVANSLFSKINKTKRHPGNLELLAIAGSACCRISFQASLEKKYGILPERLYLKAAKLCSEHNVLVEWHQDGFICSKGCKSITDSHQLPPLKSLSDGSFRPMAEIHQPAAITSEWAMDECHYIINFNHSRQESTERAIVLCDDISFGKESVPIACVVDEHLLGSLHGSADGDDGQTNACFLPWESFTYVTKPLLDQSLDLGSQSLQLGCGCAHSTCSPKACDHVYLFDNDYEDAKDINGKSMKGRFPYDDKGRIILEEGYLVYECNRNCSCDKNCPNRVLQNGVRAKLEIFKTEDKGWAVRAGEPIDHGTFVCEYIGEVIDEQEANKRRQRYVTEGCSFIYEIDARVNDMIRLIEGEASYAIDATKYGNVSRYINHR